MGGSTADILDGVSDYLDYGINFAQEILGLSIIYILHVLNQQFNNELHLRSKFDERVQSQSLSWGLGNTQKPRGKSGS